MVFFLSLVWEVLLLSFCRYHKLHLCSNLWKVHTFRHILLLLSISLPLLLCLLLKEERKKKKVAVTFFFSTPMVLFRSFSTSFSWSILCLIALSPSIPPFALLCWSYWQFIHQFLLSLISWFALIFWSSSFLFNSFVFRLISAQLFYYCYYYYYSFLMVGGRRQFLIWVFVVGLLGSLAEGIGVNWGTQASHPLPPKIVVQLLKDNGFNKVKLFDADSSTMKALAGSGIEVMAAIPNNMLDDMTSYDAAKKWVKRNVARYNFPGGVNIKWASFFTLLLKKHMFLLLIDDCKVSLSFFLPVIVPFWFSFSSYVGYLSVDLPGRHDLHWFFAAHVWLLGKMGVLNTTLVKQWTISLINCD